MSYILVIVGLIFLVIAGNIMIRGAVSIAENFGLSKLVIGLTVVAFGTSAPELVVGINAALTGVPTLALGNMVGSNIANILLVIGLPIIFFPFAFEGQEIKQNYILMLAGTLIFILLCFNGPFTKVDALLLIALLLIFLVNSYKRSQPTVAVLRPDVSIVDPLENNIKEVLEQPLTTPRAILSVLIGLLGLVYGADILVKGGVEIARDFNVSEAVIGLTIIAVGTSLPELVTAIIALKKNHGEVALGNVIGSNIFNLFAIMGGTALVADVPVPASFLSIDLWVMLISSAALLPFVIWKIKLNRITGLIFCSGYIIYLFTLSNSS